MKKGIDISKWQGDVDFFKVKKSGVEFVIVRAGYGTKTDSKFFEYVNDCIKATIPIVGIYHFSYAENVTEVIEEARLCIKNIKEAKLSNDTIVFFDLEYNTVKKAALNSIVIDKAKCTYHTKVFCNEIIRLGYIPGVYSNLDYYKNMYDTDTLDSYMLWLADWSGVPDYDCDIHQYSSTGQVDGIQSNVDMNYMDDTKPAKLKDTAIIVKEVLAGKWGVGLERRSALLHAGYDYSDIQETVNNACLERSKKTIIKTDSEIAKEVIDGLWGNGLERKDRIEIAGYCYEPIQELVNGLLEYNELIDELANEVISGLWGIGSIRKEQLRKSGYNYLDIQKRVNELMN